MAKPRTYSYKVKMNLAVTVNSALDSKVEKERIKELILERLHNISNQDDDEEYEDDDEEDSDGGTTADETVTIEEVIGEKIILVRKGIVCSEEEVSAWLLSNPGYSTSRTSKGVKFGPFGSQKTYEASTLLEAVSEYINELREKEEQTLPAKQVTKKSNPLVDRYKKRLKSRKRRDDDEE